MTDADRAHDVPPADAADETDELAPEDGLLSRLRLIEDQPLERRAEAFALVHDELRTALESGEPGDR